MFLTLFFSDRHKQTTNNTHNKQTKCYNCKVDLIGAQLNNSCLKLYDHLIPVYSENKIQTGRRENWHSSKSPFQNFLYFPPYLLVQTKSYTKWPKRAKNCFAHQFLGPLIWPIQKKSAHPKGATNSQKSKFSLNASRKTVENS